MRDTGIELRTSGTKAVHWPTVPSSLLMLKYKAEDITDYRNKSDTNPFTEKKSPAPKTSFMQEYDDSLQHLLNPEQ